LAVGTLAIGMIFIAGVFPVAIHFSTVASEQTIAAVVADEAFAKIRLYAVGDPCQTGDDIELNQLREVELRPYGSTDFNSIFPAIKDCNVNEFAYPSDPNIDISEKQYYWSALLRLLREYDSGDNDPNRLVQVTVFVCRKNGPNLKYLNPDPGATKDVDWPMPVRIDVENVTGKEDELKIKVKESENPWEKTSINDGYMIVDDQTGRIYRVLERYAPYGNKPADYDQIILLDRNWDDRDWNGDTISSSPDKIWVVPPPLAPGATTAVPETLAFSGGYPCIAIYQKVIRF